MTVTLEQIIIAQEDIKVMQKEIKLRQDDLEAMIKAYEEQEETEFPKDGDTYYFINPNGSIQPETYELEYDREAYLIGNCFRTKEEAEFAVECLKVLAELKRCGGKIEYKRYTLEGKDFFISYLDGEILVHSIDSFLGDWKMWFPTKEAAQKAIDTIGEERLLKYWFNVEM